MNFDDEIREAEAVRVAAAESLQVANKRLAELYVRRSKEMYGIEPGLRVRRAGHEYLVTEIRPESWKSKPWLSGKKIKKDGEPGEAIVTIYSDWEICKS